MEGEPLHLLQVSPSDIGGGAERVAADLHLGLLARGQDSWLALGADHGRYPNSLQIPNNAMRSTLARAVLKATGLFDPAAESSLPPLIRRAARFTAEPARYLSVMQGHEDFEFPATRSLPDLPPSAPDVMHLHNLHGAYFDIRELPALTARLPVVLTMHDTWLITGHCAYPMECEGWRTGCLSCPAPGVYVPLPRDAARDNFRLKTAAVRASRLRVATPSAWLMRMVEESEIADALAERRVIPNGVDTRVFSPGDRLAARAELGLPADARVIMFAARSPKASDFKGYDVLERALQAIGNSVGGHPALVLTVGQNVDDAVIGGIPVRSVPFVEDRGVLSTYYRAADVYLHPARAESFGLAVLEAMACGTPVVASRVGGIPEIVEDGLSGLLVEPGDPAALAEAARRLLLDDALGARLAEAGVARASELTLDRQVEAYLEWYRELAWSRADAPQV